MALISNFIVISIFIALVYFFGLLSFLTDYQPNNCDMTYMFEYPQFVKISMPNNDKYSKYGLYAYSEGKFTEKARAMKFDGIPVLFVPGNAGSYKQVRSLASVALRKALNSRSRFHFDFFAVDLNDELSGLNGALLDEQTLFINSSIDRVLSLYPDNRPNQPTSVILMGHSMGGVAAHAVSIDNDLVNTLITMGSPHRSPGICLDWYMKRYYERLKERELQGKKNRTFITIGAGPYDRLVNSWLTNANSSTLNVVTTAVPAVWLSMDHACIMWCKQLVLAIIRAMFDSVDPNTRQISPEHSIRQAAFKHHLLHNSGINLQQTAKYRAPIHLEYKGEWREDLRRQFSAITAKNRPTHVNFMVRLFDDPKHQALFIQAINLHASDWIYACTANVIKDQGRVCDEAIHLSHRSEIVPSAIKFEKRKNFYFDLFRLKRRYPNITHVIARVPPSAEPVMMSFDIHNPRDRTVTIDVPLWFSLTRKMVIRETMPDALRYVIEIPGFNHIAQTYLLYIDTVICKSNSHQAMAKLYVPWAHHDYHIFLTDGIRKPLVMRLHTSKPLNANGTAKVILTLDPTCQYQVSIRSSIVGILTQITRYYTPMLVANMAAVVLMTCYSQLQHLSKEKKCPNFQAALSLSTKPYYLVTIAKLISRTLGWGRLTYLFPTPDGQYLLNDNMDFFILPLLLYITGVGITYLLSLLLWSMLIISESTVHRFAAKAVTKTLGGAIKWSDWLITAVHKVPCVVAVTLVGLGITTCGGMASVLGVVYYFLKLTQMCQEYIEGLVFRYLKKIVFKFLGFFKRKKSRSQETNLPDQYDALDPQTASDLYNLTERRKARRTNEKEDKKKKHEEKKDVKEDKSKAEQSKDQLNEPSPGCSKDGDTVSVINDGKKKGKPEKGKDEGKKERKKSRNDSIHFHFSLFMIWVLMAAMSSPYLLTWARNYQYNKSLQPDPSYIPGVLITMCAVFLWQMELPKANKLYYKEVGMFLYGLAIICLVYTPISLYRIPYLLAVSVLVITMHQMFGPEEPELETEEDILEEPDPVDKISDIKSKLE